MAKVYLSSTKLDLDAERNIVMRELLDAEHQPTHSYRGSGDPLVTSCLDDVAKSDIYVLLLGRRYGHRPPQDNAENLSITHLEFRHAVDLGKPLVVLEQAKPPMELSDADQGRDADDASRKLFWAEVRSKVVPGRFSDESTLIKAVLNGVHEAQRRLQDRQSEGAPAITPGVSPPHARLLSRALLLIHLAGPDDLLAARLVGALGAREVGWATERWRWNVEDGIDWRTLDQRLAGCRAAAVLLTDSAPRFGEQAQTLQQVMAFVRRQCGFSVGLVVGAKAAAMPWLQTLGLSQLHRLDTWAADTSGAVTADLAQARADMRTMHPDIEESKLVGLQCVVVAMTHLQAVALRDDPMLRDNLTGEQRRYLDDALARLKAQDADWPARYGAAPEDWQPFGARDGDAFPALAVLAEVVEDINGQEVMPRRDQEALRGHRIRLRRYAFEPMVAQDPRVLKLMPQVLARRVLVLVDELSLCHPLVRAAAADTLSDPQLAVATVSPFDPPTQTVEAALSGNSVLQLGALKARFLQSMDPSCELNLASSARLRRWLRLSIPETLTGQAGNALEDRRQQFRQEAGLRR